MSTAQQIIDDFKRDRWKSNAMEQTLELVIPDPAAAVALLSLALDAEIESPTFLDAAINFIPEDAFPDLIDKTINALRMNPANKVGESIISYATLQSLHTLHPYLGTLFELAPNHRAYYENWPWRESGKRSFPFLQQILHQADADEALCRKAYECLWETRDEEMMAIALAELALHRWRREYPLAAGYEYRENAFRRLCSPQVYHIMFDAAYLGHDREPYWRRLIFENHPTWIFPDQHRTSMKFGGVNDNNCLVCGEQLHHIITLDPIPVGLPITYRSRLELATCLSCLGWKQQVLCYHHDSDGTPTNIGLSYQNVTPEFPTKPFIPTTVYLARTPERWRWQDWALANSRENLHRVGGEPCWIQGPEYPDCPECYRRMSFLLQLDGNFPLDDQFEWLWGAGGLGYCFWCDQCKVSAFTWQCT